VKQESAWQYLNTIGDLFMGAEAFLEGFSMDILQTAFQE
jgi:hypothetical protein